MLSKSFGRWEQGLGRVEYPYATIGIGVHSVLMGLG